MQQHRNSQKRLKLKDDKAVKQNTRLFPSPYTGIVHRNIIYKRAWPKEGIKAFTLLALIYSDKAQHEAALALYTHTHALLLYYIVCACVPRTGGKWRGSRDIDSIFLIEGAHPKGRGEREGAEFGFVYRLRWARSRFPLFSLPWPRGRDIVSNLKWWLPTCTISDELCGVHSCQ